MPGRLSRPFVSMPSLRLLLAACITFAAVDASAAGVTVRIADAAGKPLADAVVMLEPASGKAAVQPMADVEIAQAKRRFEPRVTLITTGTRVNFPNFDTVRHHVYSFSAAKTFELKLYAGVPAAPVTFDKPGIAVLGCNIHDRMAAWVVVADTPWSGRTGADGSVRVDAVPAGAYRLVAWHPGLPPGAAPSTQPLSVGAADTPVAITLAVAAEP